MENRQELDRIAERLTNEKTDINTMRFIVGPTYPQRLYELQTLYNRKKGDVDPYKELPLEELAIYAVKVSSPNIVDVVFHLDLVDISESRKNQP